MKRNNIKIIKSMKTYIVVFQDKKSETLKCTVAMTAKNFNEIVEKANIVKRTKLKNEFYIKSISEV